MKNKVFLKFEGLGYIETLLSILDSIHEAIVIMAKDSTIIYANQAYSRILHVPITGVLGKKMIDVDPTAPCLESLKTQEPIFDGSHYIKSRGIHIIGDTTCIYAGKTFVGVANIFRDITAMVNLDKKLSSLQQHADVLKRQLDYYSRDTLPDAFKDLLGNHPIYIQILKLASQVASTEATVLIEGESGVGKDLLARAIHDASLRRDKRFVAVNCAAIPEALFESELFGYAPGAFTGANVKGKKGKFFLAHDGTIFLDEVGELPSHMQAKLLRVLQNGELDEIGSNSPSKVNVRVIAATNQDLQTLVAKGRFRQDLYYRLNIVPITIPPLREHKEDILLLSSIFLKEFNEKYQKKLSFHDDVAQLLYDDNWPGNIRELQNVIRHAVIMAKNPEITLEDLPPYLKNRAKDNETKATGFVAHSAEAQSPARIDRDRFISVLKTSNYNRSKAMKALGISRGTFYKKYREYGLAGIKYHNSDIGCCEV